MPNMTIPAAPLITVSVLVCVGRALYSGDALDYKIAVVAGLVGTLSNLVFFYRNLNIQIKASQRQLELQKKKQDETRTA